MRLVAHTCSNTEIVAALGCADLLVGVDDHSDYPEEVVAGLPRIGKDLDVDPDKVLALQPDLVITSLTVPGHERVVARLAEARLPMLVLSPRSLMDVARDIRLVAGVLGVPERGAALAGRFEAAFAEIPEPAPDAPRLMVEWWPKPVIAAARRSWVDDLLRAAGARNAFGAHDADTATPTDEQIMGVNPDAVVISWCGVPLSHYRTEVVTRRPGWQEVDAVRGGHVYPISEAFLGRPGPRLLDGLEALRAVVARVQRG